MLLAGGVQTHRQTTTCLRKGKRKNEINSRFKTDAEKIAADEKKGRCWKSRKFL
jgi:hypothetical protein